MNPDGRYRNRREAGQFLAASLQGYEVGIDPLVLGLPRGGVPVAAEVAETLGAPLDVFLVRKLGLPSRPELAMGAIASGGVQLLDRPLIAEAEVSKAELAAVIELETEELRRREQAYRPGGPPPVGFRPAIVVDDGLATGFTMRAAVAALRRAGCPRITVAVPVGARSTCRELAREVDLLVCPVQPDRFHAVGAWYVDFSATNDEEVHACLARLPRAEMDSRPRPSEGWR
jgi:predicted phosphoribosyltransferase